MTNEQFTEALNEAYRLLVYGRGDAELVDPVKWQDDCDKWLDAFAPSKIKAASEPTCDHPHVVLIAGTQCLKCEKMWISSKREVPALNRKAPRD